MRGKIRPKQVPQCAALGASGKMVLLTAADSVGNQINVFNILLQNEQTLKKNKQPTFYFTIFEWQTRLSGQILGFQQINKNFLHFTTLKNPWKLPNNFKIESECG